MTEHKTILGVKTHWLPSYHDNLSRSVGYCVVLVAGDPAVGDYTAYSGLIKGFDEDPTQQEIEYIRISGDKIRFEEAQCLFPGILERKRYKD